LACLRQCCVDGLFLLKEQEIPVDLLQKGDIVKVCCCRSFGSIHTLGPSCFVCALVQVIRGRKLPADGEIVFGSSSIDESMITGEAAHSMAAFSSLAAVLLAGHRACR
jgi:hypothetical protein